MRRIGLLIVAALVCLIPQSGIARDHGDQGKGKGKGHWKHADDDDRERHQTCGAGCFSEDHVRVIREYYAPQGLPPGLAKKYYRTGQLPPGWEKKIRPFPVEVEQRLPPPCGGCSRGYVDGYAVVYQPRTHVIIDIHAVFTH